MTIAYPQLAAELIALLADDQKQVKAFSRQSFWQTDVRASQQINKQQLRQDTQVRAKQALAILDEIGLPSLSNIGAEAAQALSILATHDSFQATKRVLHAFEECYRADSSNTYYQAIPALTDWVLLLERRPLEFGCLWQFDATPKQPWLPTVRDFETVNDRRERYGIGSLRWPKSMAIPEAEQPWLRRRLTGLTMRDMTDAEYQELTKDYL